MIASRERPQNVGIPLTKVSRGTRFNAMDTGYLTGFELGDKRRTPLMASCVAGNLGDVKALLENAGAGSINKQDTSGNTALMHTIQSRNPALNELTDEAETYRLSIVEALIRGRPGAVAQLADVNLGDRENYTPLMAASLRGYTDIVRALLAAGAHVNLREDVENDTALTLASYRGNTEVVRLLVNAGANIEANDDTNNTALCIAANNDHLDTVEYLLSAGANIEAGLDTPLMYASNKAYTEIVELLIARGQM